MANDECVGEINFFLYLIFPQFTTTRNWRGWKRIYFINCSHSAQLLRIRRDIMITKTVRGKKFVTVRFFLPHLRNRNCYCWMDRNNLFTTSQLKVMPCSRALRRASRDSSFIVCSDPSQFHL